MTKTDISAENFVDRLLNEAGNVACDNTSKQFNEQTELPPYYDEELYKIGQKFFYKNYFSIWFSTILGVFYSVRILEGIKLLKFTKKSTTPLAAYRRYTANILHVHIWYEDLFRPRSRYETSIKKIRKMHIYGSKLGKTNLNYFIHQRDMALTQFLFMGFTIVRPEMVGIHHASEEEMKGFIHIWRVVGYLLGMDDKYNICRESVKETREICNILIEKYNCTKRVNPYDEYKVLTEAAGQGLWSMSPVIQYDVILCFLNMTLQNSFDKTSIESIKNLTVKGKFKLKILEIMVTALKYPVLGIIINYVQIFGIWLMRHFPIFGYYQFGIKHSHVTI